MVEEKAKKTSEGIISGIVSGLIVGLILFFSSLYLTSALIPNPEINASCYYKNDVTHFFLYNPSEHIAEDYNLIIYEPYWHGHGTSYVIDELCDVGVYPKQQAYTLIHCDYLPPKSYADISIDFEDKSLTQFKYSSWGRTTTKKTNEIIKC